MFLGYVRTQEGNDELKNRSKRLNARQRALLLMIEQANGNHKPMSQPWEHLATPENLDYLLHLGLVESVQPTTQKSQVKTTSSRSKKTVKTSSKKQPDAVATPYIVKAPLTTAADNQPVSMQQELDTAALKQQLAQALEKLPATALLDNELVGLVEEKLVPVLEAKAALVEQSSSGIDLSPSVELPTVELSEVLAVDTVQELQQDDTLAPTANALEAVEPDNAIPEAALMEETGPQAVIPDTQQSEETVHTAIEQPLSINEERVGVATVIEPETDIQVETAATKEIAATLQREPAEPSPEIDVIFESEANTRQAEPVTSDVEPEPSFVAQPLPLMQIKHQPIVLLPASPVLALSAEPEFTVAVEPEIAAQDGWDSQLQQHVQQVARTELVVLEEELSEIFSGTEAVADLETREAASVLQGLPPIPDDEQFDLAEEILINGQKPRYDAIPVLTWQIDHE